MEPQQQNQDATSEDGVTDSPKRGPTLSTSTSSFEPLDPHDPNLSKLAKTMFEKTSDYLIGELTLTQGKSSQWTEKNPGEILPVPQKKLRAIPPNPLKQKADYKLLEAMNVATIRKCADLTDMTKNLQKNMSELQHMYESLHPVLEQINEIEANVMKLEKAAYKLDAYSKRLENKIKTLERK